MTIGTKTKRTKTVHRLTLTVAELVELLNYTPTVHVPVNVKLFARESGRAVSHESEDIALEWETLP
jgi:hypothetical protein